MTGDIPSVSRIAVLGAGHTGPVIARVALDAGYEVSIAASGDPANIELITKILVPGAEARWAADAVADANLVVLAIPLHRFPAFDPSLVAGKVVVDTMNYWPPVDGVQEMFDDADTTSSEIVARRLASSTIVKTLNHIGYHELDEHRRPTGAPDRRALGVAGDDAGAVEMVAGVLERIGYDAVRMSGLGAGRLLQPGGSVFGVSLPRREFEQALLAPAKVGGASDPRLSEPAQPSRERKI